MDIPSTLVLVRHGESERNVAKAGRAFFTDDQARQGHRGVADHRIPLTDAGHQQAQLTGQALRKRFGSFDQVFHSGYVRTIETMKGLLSVYNDDERARINIDANLFIRERDTGHAYDMTEAENSEAFPYMHEYWTTAGPFFAHPPGGESIAQVAQRVQLFLDMLCRNHRGERVLVVTHAGTLRAFRFLLEGWSYDEADRWLSEYPPPKNCSVTTYTADNHGKRLALQDHHRVYWT